MYGEMRAAFVVLVLDNDSLLSPGGFYGISEKPILGSQDGHDSGGRGIGLPDYFGWSGNDRTESR